MLYRISAVMSAVQTLRDITSTERSDVGIFHDRPVADEGSRHWDVERKSKAGLTLREGVESQPRSCSNIASEGVAAARGCSKTIPTLRRSESEYLDGIRLALVAGTVMDFVVRREVSVSYVLSDLCLRKKRPVQSLHKARP
jgi:hypothetical protein